MVLSGVFGCATTMTDRWQLSWRAPAPFPRRASQKRSWLSMEGPAVAAVACSRYEHGRVATYDISAIKPCRSCMTGTWQDGYAFSPNPANQPSAAAAAAAVVPPSAAYQALDASILQADGAIGVLVAANSNAVAGGAGPVADSAVVLPSAEMDDYTLAAMAAAIAASE